MDSVVYVLYDENIAKSVHSSQWWKLPFSGSRKVIPRTNEMVGCGWPRPPRLPRGNHFPGRENKPPTAETGQSGELGTLRRMSCRMKSQAGLLQFG